MSLKRLLGLVGLMIVGCVSAQAAGGPELTLGNLQKAYQEESSAQARFAAFAGQADKEGYKSVATLFRAASRSESIHADKHADMVANLGGKIVKSVAKIAVGTTKENLEAALKMKTADKDSMYPGFIKQAKLDKQDKAEMSFMGGAAAAGAHIELFTKALSKLDDWKAPGKVFGVCTVCGFTLMGNLPAKCPICDSPKDKFEVFK